MQNPLIQFRKESVVRAASYQNNRPLQETYHAFLEHLIKAKYTYNFFWLGVPIIQTPQDIQALQEIIWETNPSLIIETGIAHGGSLIFSASMLAILEMCGKIQDGRVIGIDIDIRSHNKKAILNHPLSNRITMIEGSSIDSTIIKQVKSLSHKKDSVMVCLDSNHTHDHVLAELRAYAPLVSVGNYCVVGDTVIDDLPDDTNFNRPWGQGNNPKTAMWEYLKDNNNFIIDKTISSKLILTNIVDGYLKRVR